MVALPEVYPVVSDVVSLAIKYLLDYPELVDDNIFLLSDLGGHNY